jgi:hypothetical protein
LPVTFPQINFLPLYLAFQAKTGRRKVAAGKLVEVTSIKQLKRLVPGRALLADGSSKVVFHDTYIGVVLRGSDNQWYAVAFSNGKQLYSSPLMQLSLHCCQQSGFRFD